MPPPDFDSILAKPWKAGADPHEIVFRFKHGFSDLSITCPTEVRDLLVTLQNRLHAKYRNREHTKHKARQAEEVYNTMLGIQDDEDE